MMSRRQRRWSIEQSKRAALDRLDSIDITGIPTGEDHTMHGHGQDQLRPGQHRSATLCDICCSAAWSLV
jgi:hypothetical protein